MHHSRTPAHLLSVLSVLAATASTIPTASAIGTFKDLQPGDFGYEAAVFLQEKQIMTGYGDGTFKPDKAVNRAEAMKIVAFQFMTKVDEQPPTNPYKDVPDTAWFAPSIEWARQKKIIRGPPDATTFFPTRTVTKAEFLKMMFLAYGVDPNAFGDISLPLSADVKNSKEWHYPFFRYAISTSVQTVAPSGKFSPGKTLTRGEVAVLLHRFLLYRVGQRTQALLDHTHEEIVKAQAALQTSDLTNAEYASARALLSARGAHASMPDEVPVKVAVKTAEAIRALVRAYRAGILDRDLDAVIKHSQDAWFLAGQAKAISPEAEVLAVQIQTYATNFAASARKQKKR
ncbi:MAG: hypothetical protein Greene041619_208 [Candidatus Peregrinibacteria bacterium Greene0416_19]|nr:MAG: hypothetical protein Greene041619_208 [Candidatus Peregrinibacteria bacterium Greene0416_19]